MEATDSETMNSADREDGPYRGVGYDLHRARLAANYTVEDICRAIRISETHLTAIENGRFSDLPGPTYVSGFVRTYAGFVGLDPDEIILRLKSETDVPKLKPEELHFPEPERESRAPSPVTVIVALLCAGLLYGGWYYFRQAEWEMPDDRELVADVPARLQQQIPAGPDSGAVSARNEESTGATASGKRPTRAEFYSSALPVDEGVEVVGDTTAQFVAEAPVEAPAELPVDLPGAEMPPSEVPSNAGGSSDSEPREVEDNAQLPEDVPQPDAMGERAEAVESAIVMRLPRQKPATASDALVSEEISAGQVGADPAVPRRDGPSPTTGEAAVQLRALENVWIQLSTGSGDVLLARLLAVDEVVVVPDQPGIRLTVGDAGALVAVLDGEQLPAFGPAGEVVRDLSLDPADLRAGVDR